MRCRLPSKRPARRRAAVRVFGARVHELRLRRGLTQRELAGEDVTKAFISQVELGRTGASLRVAGILATRLGIPLAELVRGEPVIRRAVIRRRLLAIARDCRDARTCAALEELSRELASGGDGCVR